MSAIPLVCFNIVEFHQVDRVKCQFNGEQSMLGASLNINRFLTSTGRGEDEWWPDRLDEWYRGWTSCFEEGHRISIQHTFDYRPTQEYWDWRRGACRVRNLSSQDVLDEPRLSDLHDDIQPIASQPRDVLHLPWDVPNRRRRAREVRADTRRPTRKERGAREREPGEGVRRERVRSRRVRLDVELDEEAEYDRQEEHGDILAGSDDSPLPPPPGPRDPSGSRGQLHRPVWETSPPSPTASGG
ncbi:uncharacterized protein DS421_20g687620 [Arachis hypogaea]|nr:uncharacterized protein DS421_20g687620 [Arachis hypogaea]